MTDVVRGAGRRKHEANKKHQQRTPLPPRGSTAIAEANAIIAEEVEATKAKAKGERVTKAQELALAAEEAGWDVERKVEGDHKTLIARRGEETLEAHWDNEKSCVPLGWHSVAGRRAKFQHVTVAKKILETPADVALRNAESASAARKAPASVSHKTLAQGVAFNPATATDEEVMEALLGREISWRSTLNPETTVVAVVPLEGKQTRLDDDDLDDRATRQLTFCDADGGGYMTLRLSSLLSVGALKDDHGHMLTATRHRAMEALKEGRKEAKR